MNLRTFVDMQFVRESNEMRCKMIFVFFLIVARALRAIPCGHQVDYLPHAASVDIFFDSRAIVLRLVVNRDTICNFIHAKRKVHDKFVARERLP